MPHRIDALPNHGLSIDVWPGFAIVYGNAIQGKSRMRSTGGPGDEDSDALAATATSDDSPRAAPLSVESLVRGAALGRYMIVAEIGRGGMGIVYSAFDPDLDRKVALKVLRKSRDPAARTRLLREAKAMAKLSHPNVVTVFEVATDANKDFVSMEFVDGQTLDEWQQEDHSIAEVLQVYRQAGEGLAAAHRAGLVHRDFKPQNVLIDKEGRVRVTDFGLAQQMSAQVTGMEETMDPDSTDDKSPSESGPSLTRTGSVMGTPAYMSPEQHLAEAADARTDQYSFCVALYEALDGSKPYEASSFEDLKAAVLKGRSAILPESVAVSGKLREAVAKGTARKREDRHESMDDLLPLLHPAEGRGGTLLLVALIAAALVAVFVFGMSASKEGPACVADRSQLEGVWDATRRDKVRDAFASTGVTGASEIFAKFQTIADSYADQLVAMRVEICEAGRGEEALSDQLVLRRLNCLERHRQRLSNLTKSFANVDPRGVDRALEAGMALPSVADCADTAALLRDVSLPPAADRAAVTELQSQLREAESDAEAGHLKAALEKAEAVRQRAIELDYKPLLAEAHVAVGNLYRRDSRVREAEEEFENSILAAEESGYTEFRARALVGATLLIASGSSRFDEARRYAKRARAAIAQWGEAPELSLKIDRALALISAQEGQVQEAVVQMESALKRYSEQGGTKPVTVARVQDTLAALLIQLGRYEEAHKLALNSYQLVRETLADTNPKTYAYLATLTQTHRMRGEYDEARRLEAIGRTYWASEPAEALLKEDPDYQDASRSVRGQVRDESGNPVALATVVCGEKIAADGRDIHAVWNARGEALRRKRTTQTTTDGRFHCAETSIEDLVVLAEHSGLGRSSAAHVSADATMGELVQLELRLPGSLSGKVVKDGKPVPAVAVQALPVADAASQAHGVLTFVEADGSFHFERLAPGKYLVFAGHMSTDRRSSIRSQEIEIFSGKSASLDFDQSGGDAAIDLVVRGKAGAAMPSVQVLLVPGHIEGGNAKDLNTGLIAAGTNARTFFVNGGEHLAIEAVQAGQHSLCVVPIGGDYRDPEHMKLFSKESLDRVLVYCQDLKLEPGETKELEIEAPAWKPIIKIENAAPKKN